MNLRDTDHAHERYREVVSLVRNGSSALHFLSSKDFYEGHIDPQNGSDWNQIAPIDTRPTIEDLKNTVADYLSWQVSTLIRKQPKEEDGLGKL